MNMKYLRHDSAQFPELYSKDQFPRTWNGESVWMDRFGMVQLPR